MGSVLHAVLGFSVLEKSPKSISMHFIHINWVRVHFMLISHGPSDGSVLFPLMITKSTFYDLTSDNTLYKKGKVSQTPLPEPGTECSYMYQMQLDLTAHTSNYFLCI